MLRRSKKDVETAEGEDEEVEAQRDQGHSDMHEGFHRLYPFTSIHSSQTPCEYLRVHLPELLGFKHFLADSSHAYT